MDLTKSQKEFLRENVIKTPDLLELTRLCFEDSSLDGRSKQGRAIRKFLAEEGLDYSTTGRVSQEAIDFTQKQIDFILTNAQDGVSSLEIAKIIFPDKNIKPLSHEQREVLREIRKVNPDWSKEDALPSGPYIAPKSPSRIIKKINDATGYTLQEGKLNRQKQICVEKLGVNLGNSRFVKIINGYTNQEDKTLFEQEFVRLTWDKPDLTADEINLYLNACKEVINLEVISSHMNKLNDLFNEADEQQEMSVRLAEIIKAKSAEYHQCETRIENLTKKLQGDRRERIAKRQSENASFLSIVQLFQEEEERETMVRMAEMQKQAVSEEANRLESMAEWKARILGISKEDVI